MRPTPPRAALALALCALAAPAAAAPLVESAEEVRHLEEWPAVEDEATVELDVKRLRKASTAAMGEEAHAALVAAGAGVAPYLLGPLGKERDEDARARILEVLDAVVGPEHTRLLARSFGDDAEEVRVWALRTAARHPDAGTRAAAEAAWAKVQERGKKAAARERLAAALAVTAAGSLAGLDELAAAARDAWAAEGADLRHALEAVRGPEATKAVAPRLSEPEREAKLAGLRLLAGCGDPDAARLVGPFLDQQDASLRLEAINALRGIVDGDPPLERLAVFEAIERANKWKERL